MQNNALTTKQRALINELLAGSDHRAAARKLGVNISTVWRWMQLDTFQQEYQATQAELFEAALTKLKLSTDSAVSVLVSIMLDVGASDNARIRAAQCLLEKSIDLHKLADLETRLQELEAIIKDAPRLSLRAAN